MIDFEKAVKQHQQWQKMFLVLLNSENIADVSTEHVLSSRECGLGKWMRAELSNQYTDDANYQRLIKIHDEYHHYAGVMMSLIQNNNHSLAEQVKPEFLKVSDEIDKCINVLKDTLKLK